MLFDRAVNDSVILIIFDETINSNDAKCDCCGYAHHKPNDAGILVLR